MKFDVTFKVTAKATEVGVYGLSLVIISPDSQLNGKAVNMNVTKEEFEKIDLERESNTKTFEL